MRKKLAKFFSLLVALALVGGVFKTPIPAKAAAGAKITEGLYYIQTLGGMNLDVSGGGTANHTNVMIATPHWGANQLFRITKDSKVLFGNVYYITCDFAGGKLLDADLKSDSDKSGSNVQIYEKYGENTNQKWTFISNDDGTYTIGSYYDEPIFSPIYVLDVDDERNISVPGTNVQIWKNNGTSNQKFKLIPYSQRPSKLTINVTSEPETITQGNSFGLKGSIDSVRPITRVVGQILDANGNVVQETLDTFGDNVTSANINTLNVNKNLLFGQLAPGSYKLVINADDDMACYRYTKNFTVKDATKPVISDARISNVTSSGYDVTCTVTDNVGIDRVQFPTWTVANGQDDIQDDWWHRSVASGKRNGNTFTFRVNTSDHNGEWGTYVTHIYAFDTSGNYTCYDGLPTPDVPETFAVPEISNVQVSNITTSGYDVTCSVSNVKFLTEVKFSTWTENNGKDDVKNANGTVNGNSVKYHVNISDHNGESGKYVTEIYAYNTQGGYSGSTVNCTVPGKVAITTQPANVSVDENSSATFSVKATGSNLSYQWQYKKSSESSWTSWSGQTSSSLSVSYSSDRNGMQVRCVVSDSYGNKVTSNAATLSYNVPLSITKQPASVKVDVGNEASFSVTAKGKGLKYLWQYKEKDATSWTDWTSKTTATISVAYAANRNGMSLRCVVTDTYGKKITSNTATLTYGNYLTITKHPSSVKVDANKDATFSVTATGKGLRYLWQYKDKGSSTWVDWTSKTTASITVAYSADRDGMSVRCVVTDSTGTRATSNAATLTYNIPLTITKQPASVTVDADKSASFSVTATGKGLKYLWQYKEAGKTTWTDWTSKTTAAISVAYADYRDGMSFRCVVTDSAGKKVTSNAATLTYNYPLSIKKQPASVTVNANNSASFSVTATGKGLKYLWQYKEAGKTSWTDWTSKTTASISVAFADSRDGMSVRCVVTDSKGKKVTSNSATLKYNYPLSIKTQPVSTTVKADSAASFSVKAEGKGLTYLWQYKEAGKTTWTDWTSKTTATISVAFADYRDGMSFRCVVKDYAGKKVTSNAATLKYTYPLSITKQPVSTTVKADNAASFSVTASGKGLKYLWQYKEAGTTTWTDWTSKTTATISVAYASYRDGMSFRCVVTDAEGKKVTSNSATLTYNIPLSITKQPASVTVSANSSASFSVTATGKGLKYLWQYKEAGKTTWTDWTSKTTASISVAFADSRDGMSVRCVVTDSKGVKVTSNSATLTYNYPLSITKQPASTTVNKDSAASFSVAASGKGLSYMWQYKEKGSSTWTDWTSKTTATISVAYADYRDGMSFRCVVKDSSGKKVTSNAATLTYNIPLTITKQPTNITVEKKKLAFFSVKAEGKGLTYLWQYKEKGASSWTDWTSKTTASIDVAYSESRNGMSVRCIVTDASGKKVTSSSATLTYK